MNAKVLVTDLAAAINACNTTHVSDLNEAKRKISVLRYNVYMNSQRIWLQRTHGASESIHLQAPVHIYREMLVPFNAVRSGLKKLGIDPDAIGLAEGYLFDDLIERRLTNARENLEHGRDVTDDKLQLKQMAAKLKEIGYGDEMKELREIHELLSNLEAAALKPVVEYVALVNESLELRKLAEVGTINGKQEQRLMGVSSYIHRNQNEMIAKLSILDTEKRSSIIGGHSMYEFRKKVTAASKRYATLAEKAAQEQAAANFRAEEEERELWRSVAKVECQHRYGHENYAVNSDWNGDGHFYSGPDQMEWGIPPDDGDHGLLVLQSGEQHCLCHWHKLSDDRFIPRKYSADQAA
jgi:hypothetical protein